MTGRVMIDPVEGWVVSEAETGALRVTQPGTTFDEIVTAPAAVHSLIGNAAFCRLTTPPAGVPLCEVLP